jgi:hypothetical protein
VRGRSRFAPVLGLWARASFAPHISITSTVMVGLIEIAPAVETVAVQDASVAVHVISAKGLAQLLDRFPERRKLMTGQEVEAEQLMAIGCDAVAAIIAAGWLPLGPYVAQSPTLRPGFSILRLFCSRDVTSRATSSPSEPRKA